jgi:hypothetical protein
MQITRKMVQGEMLALQKRELRAHDLCSIGAMHPDIKMRAAAMFLLRGIA